MNGIRLRYVVPLHDDLIHDLTVGRVDCMAIDTPREVALWC